MSVPARRTQVTFATAHGLSQRRACTLMRVSRSELHYRSRMAEKERPVLTRMAELSAQYPRYGYRRIRIFLGRDGHGMSFGRAHRLWRSARLQVPRKRPRKRIATGRPRPNTPTGANQVWSYDFVFDWCANGQHDARPQQATGRLAAISGDFAPRPVAQPSRKGHEVKKTTRADLSS